ncbi:MAG: hypothetical protein ACLFQV_11475 [Vulcanimicrobiota bacterium]
MSVKIQNHLELQEMADNLSTQYLVDDPFTLRSALLEVLQNTLQHSDGRFALNVTPKYISVVNLIREGNNNTTGLGLKLYRGIATRTCGDIFLTRLFPHKVCLNKIDLEFEQVG